MALITLEELARSLIIGVFGGAAGLCTVTMPGSPLWLIPAGVALGGCALTVAEVRAEVQPLLAAGLARRPRWALGSPAGAVAPAPAPVAPAPRAGPVPVTAAPPPVSAAGPDEPAANLSATLASTPHRLIIGHTRGGKTTLIHHLATGWAAAGERVLVGDPDAAPGLWPGCEVRGYGDDVAGIGALLAIVAAEVTARRAQRAQGVRHFAPLHLVIDEAQDVLPALEGALGLFEDVARRGGKLNIRMTIGVQDTQVRTLGLAGKSELLRNFQVADVLKSREGRRVALLRDAATGQRVAFPIPQLTDPESLITRPAAGPRTPGRVAAPVDALLAQLLAAPVATPLATPAPVSRAVDRQSTPAPVSVAVTGFATATAGGSSAVGRSGTGVSVTGLATAAATATGRAGANVRATAMPGAGTECDPGAAHVIVNVTNHADRDPQRRRGLDMRRRRARNQSTVVARRKAALQRAYAERKAHGSSFRKAYAELGGSSAAARAWWHAA